MIIIYDICRFKREEIKIQAWESQQKAKLEAEMRRIEVVICSHTYIHWKQSYCMLKS